MAEDALPFTVAPAVGGVGGRSFFRLFIISMRTQLRPDRVVYRLWDLLINKKNSLINKKNTLIN